MLAVALGSRALLADWINCSDCLFETSLCQDSLMLKALRASASVHPNLGSGMNA